MISVMEKVRSNVRSQLFEREMAALTGEMLFSGGNRSVGQMCTDMSYVVTEVPVDCIRVDLVSEAACMPPALENLDNYLLTDWACMMPTYCVPYLKQVLWLMVTCTWQSVFVTVCVLPPKVIKDGFFAGRKMGW